MSALGALTGTATGQVWKIAAAVLAGLLLVVGVAAGVGWWMLGRELHQAKADLAAATARADEYQSAIREQSRATEALAKAKAEADARGAAARAQAAEQGKRLDGALGRLAGARVTTCAEAMPYVNQMLEDVK